MSLSARIRPILIRITAIGLVYCLMELAAATVFVATTGTLPSLAQFQEMQTETLHHYRQDNLNAATGETATIYASHPYLGYTYKPSTILRDIVAFYTTAEGFPQEYGIGDDRDFIVGVTGGSVAVQVAVAGAAQLKAALEQRMPGRSVRIVPLAVGGYAAPQQLLATLYSLLKGYRIDLLVNLDGFNDITRGYFGIITPTDIFTSRRGGLDFDLATIGHIALYKSWQDRITSLALRLRYSYTAGTLWYLFDRFSRKHTTALWQKAMASHEKTQRDEGDQQRRALLWKRTSLMLHRTMQTYGGRYVEFLQPNIYLAGSKRLSEEEKQLAAQGYDGASAEECEKTVTEGYRLLQQEAQALRAEDGVTIYDLTGIFSDDDDTLYLDSCCHFNKEGVEKLTAAMGEAIGQSLAAP